MLYSPSRSLWTPPRVVPLLRNLSPLAWDQGTRPWHQDRNWRPGRAWCPSRERAARMHALGIIFPSPAFIRRGGGDTSASTPATPSVPTPAAFWRLEEASGTRVDSTGNGHDLDANSNTPGNATGHLGSALSLASASSQEIHHASEAGLKLTGDATWACWLNGTTFGGTNQGNFPYAMFKGDAFTNSGSPEWDIHVGLAGAVSVGVWRGTAQFGPAGTNLSTGTWYLVAGRYTASGTTVDISVNGAAWSGAASVGGAANTGTHQMTMGRLIGLGSTFWNGLVDAAGFWSVAFTNADISQLYFSGVGTEYYSGAWH